MGQASPPSAPRRPCVASRPVASAAERALASDRAWARGRRAGGLRAGPALSWLALACVACGGANELSPVTREQAISACLSFAGCVPGQGIHACLDRQLLLFSPEEVRCLAAAGSDCARAGRCVGVGVSDTPADGGCEPSCVGERYRTCAEGFAYEVDCARWGGEGATCQSNRLRAGCAIGSCTQTREYCDGTRRIVCDAGLLVVKDCRTEGAFTCAHDGALTACVGAAGVCAGAEGSSRCDGDVLVRCAGGREERRDCRVGFTGGGCRVNSAGVDSAAFCGYDTACRPRSGDEACSGDGLKLTFCAAGEPRTVDCVGLGFRGCTGLACAGRL